MIDVLRLYDENFDSVGVQSFDFLVRKKGSINSDYVNVNFDFSREANIINRIATGCSALEIKTYLGVGLNELTRDNLTNEYNEKIAFLQEQNILLLGMGLPIVQRVNMLISFFDTKYPDAKPLQSYYDREYLLRERQKILDCLTK